jgi:hypothetical protein
MDRVAANFVPRLLTDEQKEWRVKNFSIEQTTQKTF